ncbi:von Hippel-Lindau tumor suppressor homolog [Colias croceus]|uniref:von Hippel-Lindau tumor suppressor homolog n=1 Tax=Colias crocea TaxID=72248 RepID=UPI001E27EB01|nr:von Hippel-Lindau tumor suppressor homolog [Colias croceus]
MPESDESDLVYEIDDKGQNMLVRSLESTQRAYLRFTNKTSRPVDVWWRDFRGMKRHYVRLDEGSHFDINSFITHPWEFTDVATKERYVINNNPIYRPPRNIGGMMFRTNWNITISVRSLRQTVLLSLALHLKDSNAVNALGLPRTLAEELQHLTNLFHTPLPPPSRD